MDDHGDPGIGGGIVDGINIESNCSLAYMPTVTITGGTGLIGTALTHLLIDNGHRVIILSRKAPPGGRPIPRDEPDSASPPHSAAAFYGRSSGSGLQRLHWDPTTGFIDPEAIRQADYIVHLA